MRRQVVSDLRKAPRKIRGALRTTMVIALLTIAIDLPAAQLCKRYCGFWADAGSIKAVRVMSPYYHHDLAPNSRATDVWGPRFVPLVTNSQGFKDATHRDIPLAGDAYRILLIGDSFTEGVGVRYCDSFAGILARRLSRDGIEVLNAAVAAYAPSIYFRKIKHLIEDRGLTFDEVVVFLDMSDPVEDARYFFDAAGNVTSKFKQRTELLAPGPLKRSRLWLRDNSIMVRFFYALRLRFKNRRNQSRLRETETDVIYRRTLEAGYAVWTWKENSAPWAEAAKGIVHARHNMTRLAELLAAHDIPLSAVIYPWPGNIVHDPPVSRQQVIWREWAAARGIELIDLFPSFRDGQDPRATIMENFIALDFHWNEAGHRRVAKAFLLRFRPGLKARLSATAQPATVIKSPCSL